MLRGLILDFDGVVVDSHPVHIEAWTEVLASAGVYPEAERLEFVREGHTRETIVRHFLGDLPPEQLSHYGARKESFFRQRADKVRPVPGILDLLDSCGKAGLPVAIASSGSTGRIQDTITRLGLAPYFHAIVAADQVSKAKPDPQAFSLAAQQLGLCADQVLACEDSVNGVIAAKAAGMKCVGVGASERAPRLRQAGADQVIPDFTGTSLESLRRLFTAGNGDRRC